MTVDGGTEINPLEGGGKNYIIYAGDDAAVTFTATDDSGKLERNESRCKRDLNDNALNGNFSLVATMTGDIAPITGDITATSANPATITTTIHLKDDLIILSENTWHVMLLLLTMRQI